jgi:dihydroorotase
MSAGAALFGLTTPRILPGEAANLVVVDLEATFATGARGYVSRSENCCFHGRKLHGKVMLTLASGGVAFRERMLVQAAGTR